MTTIKIIAGSTRPGRFNTQPSSWLMEQTKKIQGNVRFELIDLAELGLPLLDEQNTPMSGKYENEHTKKWSSIVGEADGFVIVTPEYNHSIPGALKNALDYLYAEWNFKPVAYVSYGSGAGGARAVEHLRAVAGELKMFDLKEQILLPNYWNYMDQAGRYEFTEEQEVLAAKLLDQIVFWAVHMKSARQPSRTLPVQLVPAGNN
jgi:NAD(P)H-dependent FMN reductase